MQSSVSDDDHTLDLPTIRQVDISEPLRWLEAGWQDFRRMSLFSGFYGLVFILLGYALTAATWQSPILVMTFVTGFFLISPFLALGLYHLSRQREQGVSVSFMQSLLAFRERQFDMALLVTFHAVVMVAWIRLTTLLSALYLSGTSSSVSVLIDELFNTPEGLGMFALFVLTGAALAILVFVISVVSWPMLLDRQSGVINAVATSVQVVNHNKLVMVLWAVLIVGLLSIGLATLYLGLLIIMPVLGHATWHAYRSLVA
ncbi:MAG: DUF2189 domain-containing protein [Thiohalophilus sp.]|uniref:DUF2189 domain-containing protein n=1 Tax=Thiohalophilus sp. TaxID=3028392 RepID=UPI00287077E7|nr:DUF2189 domain-containing protein [Thiohalophilus sp.]MDR9436215.1 DUF2189 domain-containing protein [Thiohalophilus sp.]